MIGTSRTWGWGLLALAVTACGERERGGPATAPDGGRTVAVGSLAEARREHQATLLGDGAVLISGGLAADGWPSARAERFDPRSGRSTPLLAALGTARAGHLAVRLPDGRVWLLGGRDRAGRPLRSTELFDPADESFRPGPALTVPRDRPAGLVEGERLTLAGGVGAAGAVQAWDLRTLAPAGPTGPALPGEPRGGRLGRLGPDALFLAGAQDASGAELPGLAIEPRRGRAGPRPGALEEVVGATLVALEGAGAEGLFLVGGELRPGGRPRRELAWVPPLDHRAPEPWNEGRVPSAPDQRLLAPRQRPAVAALGGEVLVVGGLSGASPLASVERIGLGHTRPVSPLQSPRAGAELTVLAGGRVLISGGQGADGLPVAQLELYLPPGAAAPDAGEVWADEAARQAHLRDLERALLAERGQVADLQARLRDALATLARREQELSELQARLTVTLQQLAATTARNAALEAELLALREGLTRAQRDLADERARVTALQAALDQARAEIGRLVQERDRLQASAAAPQQAPVLVRTAAVGPISGFVGGTPRTR